MLSRMALAAMDSESGYLPLDYLQGHKDGLEWAARLAEANHPETGDWLYDDPIELAKAIRKGPDMPPAQPVAGSEPVKNHIGSKNALDAIVSFIKSKSNPTVKCYEEVSEQLFKDNCHGIHSHVIEYILKLGEELEDLRAEQDEIQSAPVATTETISFDEWSRKCALQITLCYPDFREKAKYIWDSARETQQLAPAPVVSADLLHTAASAIEDLLTTKDRTGAGAWFDLPFRLRSAANAQPAPVVPDVMEPTIEAIKRILPTSNPDEYAACIGADMWNACRAAMLAATPQSPGSEPATVPGKWIPVSEQMPEVGVKVLCFPVEDEPIHAVFNGQLWLQDISWSNSDEPIDNVITCNVTHWMPLPAAPQEVNHG
ncbi:TPA: DUF551 domain-containing protein [Klebsiella pneumoniae]